MKSMNIIEFSESLQAKMRQEQACINEQDEFPKVGKVITVIRGLITELKVFVRNYTFRNQAEEIQFFKEIKPVFLSHYYYYKKIFAIHLFDSYKDAKSRQANYVQLLLRLEKFAAKNLEFYTYSMSGSTFRDACYFTRQFQMSKVPDRDENFSTGFDTKLAKLLANELVKEHILKLVNRTNSVRPQLAWTGSKTDLIELIYALHAANVCNNGSADIKQIASSFETLLGVNLGDYYRVFVNIRLRKTGQATFLEQLRTNFLKRVQELD